MAIERLIGTYTAEWSGKPVKVYIKAKITDGRLSVVGTSYEGRKAEKNIVSSGQCIDEARRVTDYAQGLSRADVDRMVAIWDRWHLNDMRAGCEHQRRWGWDTMHRLESKLVGWDYKLKQTAKVKAFRRIGRKCPACGYSYGSTWLSEELPQDVIDFVEWFNAPREVTS